MDIGIARVLAERDHYLHRRPNASFAFGLYDHGCMVGFVTFGSPSRPAIQVSACPSEPNLVVELNRLWVDDDMSRNTESWFLARALRLLPPRVVISYADTAAGHDGTVYRSANFHYAGWTAMDRGQQYAYPSASSRRYDIPEGARRVPLLPKVRYWTTTGNHNERRHLTRLCAWEIMDWSEEPAPRDGHRRRLGRPPLFSAPS